MAIQHTPAHAHASTSHAHASHGAHHAASKAKPSLSADEGDGGGFAAMLRAQPSAAKDAKADKADKPKADAKKSDDASAKDVEEKDEKDKDAKKAAKQEVDPNALTAWTPPPAPTTASLADKATADDPLTALRKAAGKGKGGGADGLAALGAGKDADKAKADPLATLALGKGAPGKADITAALAKADEAVKAATDARDSLLAMLPQPDPVAIQAGSVGASPAAVQDPNQGIQPPTPPAQATLAMPPQAPTFAPALGHQIDVWMKDGVQHAEVQLSPQELGPIRVRIEMEGATTRVHMAADVASTRDALQQAIPQLSDALGQVGISLSGGGVSDQPAFSQAQAQANADGGNGGGRSPGGRNGQPGSGDDGSLGGLAPAPRPVAQRRGLLDAYA